MLREAREFIWILANQVLSLFVPTVKEKLKTPFEVKAIFPKAAWPIPAYFPPTVTSIKRRVLEKVDVIIIVTENEAHFCLPDRSGKIDYVGFSGNDQQFHKWCKDLFLYYWEKAKPL